MSSRRGSPSTRAPHRAQALTGPLRVLLAGLLGLAAALLVSCGSSAGKLIPVADAGPLRTDFEAVQQEAQAGDGSCSATEAALEKTEHDFGALPASLDAGLRETLRQGIENLRKRALALCAQTITTSTALKTTSTTGVLPNVTQTPPPTTSTTTSTATTTVPTTTTPTTGGGTPAPGASEPLPGVSSGQGGGTGESAAGEVGGAGVGSGQEAAK
jgi:hypothetical protein